MQGRIYVAYGSNMNLAQMAIRCPTARVVGHGWLDGYALRFRGMSHGAVATIEPSPKDSVPVTIWRIHPKDEAALNRYEGFPSFYRKEMVEVRVRATQDRKSDLERGKSFTEELIPAMAYIMNPGRPLGLPSRGYLTTIVEGYEAAGFALDGLERAVKASR